MNCLLKLFCSCVLIAFLSSCYTTPELDQSPIADHINDWQLDTLANDAQYQINPELETSELTSWWQQFNALELNQLIDALLKNNPDRQVALARIHEAMALKEIANSDLYPQLAINGHAGREDDGNNPSGSTSRLELALDYEIDIWGKNQDALSAAEAELNQLRHLYRNVTLELIANITRTYFDYLGSQAQAAIAEQNAYTAQRTLDLIYQLIEQGESSPFDGQTGANLLYDIKSRIPAFQLQAKASRLQLAKLTGQLPTSLSLEFNRDVLLQSIKPVLTMNSQWINKIPHVQAAQHYLVSQSKQLDAQKTNLLPNLNLNSFIGYEDSPFIPGESIWRGVLATSYQLLDFGRVERLIDASVAREQLAYQQYRASVLTAITDIETHVMRFRLLGQQRQHLELAYDHAAQALDLAKTQYRIGEISFLDVVDSQRTAFAAQAAMTEVQVEHIKSVVDIYQSLGQY